MYAIGIYYSDLQSTFKKKYGLLGGHEYIINGAITVSSHFKFTASKRDNSHYNKLGTMECVCKQLNTRILCRQKGFDCSGCEINGVKPSGLDHILMGKKASSLIEYCRL